MPPHPVLALRSSPEYDTLIQLPRHIVHVFHDSVSARDQLLVLSEENPHASALGDL